MIPALAISALALAGCRGFNLSSPTFPPGSSSILPQLTSAEFPLDISPSGTVRLTDGIFEGKPEPGSATRLTVRLGNTIATGDLNADGVDDAVVILIVDPGGSGTFTYLAAVLNEDGVPRPVASALLGDRVVVNSLAIRDGTIGVTLLEHGPGQPLTAPPTLQQDRSFTLQDGRLASEP